MPDIRFGPWRFAPGFWPSLLTIIIFPVLVLLGLWQLDRAGQKRVMHEQYQAQIRAQELDLYTSTMLWDDNAESLLWRKLKITGRFDSDYQIILDNQVSHGKPGYFIVTPFVITGREDRVLINRGWLGAPEKRNISPVISTPEGEVTIFATVAAPPATGLFLGGVAIEKLGAGIYRAQRIDIREISTLLQRPIPPYVLRLEPGSSYGFLREWAVPGSGEAKHMGYAFQWFALAATLLFIYLVVNLKKAI